MICYFNSNGKDVQLGIQDCYLLSIRSYPKHGSGLMGQAGFYVEKDNTRQTVSLFVVKTLTKAQWLNSNDVYIGGHDK